MGKKIISLILFVLGLACIGLYFIYPTEPSSYKVIFDSQGGSSVPEQTIEKNGKVTKPADPTKDNSEFIEWQLNGVTYVFDNVVVKNMTLTALWKEISNHSVAVTIDGNAYNGSVVDGTTINIDTLGIPAKDGYTIKLYNESGEEFDISTLVTADMVLTGQYVEIKTYTVKFDSNGGSEVESQKVTDGSMVSEPSTTRSGYTLEGWYLNNTKYDFSTPVSKNITLKAKWIENGKINVTFMADDKVYKTVAVKENTKVTKPTNPTKKGNKFVEWQLNGSTYDFSAPVTSEITLIAIFEEVSTYTVSFNSDGGSSVKSQDVEVGKKATKPSNPTKAGYVFKEWQLNGKTYDFNKEVTSDLALKAVWEKEKPKYTVTFDSNGGSAVASQTVSEGETAKKPSNPTKEGYTFAEWVYSNATFDFGTEITKDITLVARYEKNADPTPTPEQSNGDIGETETEEDK